MIPVKAKYNLKGVVKLESISEKLRVNSIKNNEFSVPYHILIQDDILLFTKLMTEPIRHNIISETFHNNVLKLKYDHMKNPVNKYFKIDLYKIYI